MPNKDSMLPDSEKDCLLHKRVSVTSQLQAVKLSLTFQLWGMAQLVEYLIFSIGIYVHSPKPTKKDGHSGKDL